MDRAGARSEQIRNPLLITLWFGRHLDPDTLAGFLASNRHVHEARLARYEGIAPADPHTAAVLGFGIAYEKAVIAWIDGLQGLPDPDTESATVTTA